MVRKHSRHHNNRSRGFGSTPAPYPQASGPTPPQSFAQGGPVQYPPYPPNQQYGPPAPQYQYTQPQQPYSAPPPNQQYPRSGFQPPSYSQYNQNSGGQQFGVPVYQPPPQPQYNSRGPAQYQAPVNTYAPPNTGYHGSYPSTPTPAPAPYQPPPQQWNNTPSSSQPPFQRPQRSNSGFQREFSGTPSHHSQQQQPPRSQSQQLDYGSEAPHQTPQTPSSNSGKIQHAPRQSSQGSPVKPQIGSVPSTPASNSTNRIGYTSTINVETRKYEQVATAEKDASEILPEQETEEGEVQEGDDEEELFNWELEHIFKEPPAAETVALAQPLSAGFESTPVPLVQAWTTNVPSISRYARKENLKEFIRSVRSAPQWSYLQEDPAFAEITDEGDLIPLSELAAWMDIHHGRTITVDEVEDSEPASKKRTRSEAENITEDEQENVDQQIALEVATEEQDEEPPSKRQKNDEAEDPDEIMRTPGGRTPIIDGRGGTPCLATTDDAWAPQPGECATSPADPTETLLASLGVSGVPKPVSQEPLPPYVSKEEQTRSPQSSQTHTPVTIHQPAQVPSVNVSGSNAQSVSQNHGPPMVAPPQSNPQYGPTANAPYSNGNIPNPLYGQGTPINNPQVPPQYNHSAPPQYGPPMNAPYGNAPPHNMNGPPQYGPPASVPYNSGPPNSYPQGPPQGPPQWGPQRNSSFGNGAQYTAPQQYPQYGPPPNAPYAGVPYGPPANQYGNAAPVQYSQGPPQYNQPRHPSYGAAPPMPGQYGPVTQTSPTQYGPPQNIPYSAAPYPNQTQYQNGPTGGYGTGPPVGPPNNTQYSSMPPNPNMPPNQPQYGNLPNSHLPPRQDSGYVSARGSYSSGSGPNGLGNQGDPQDPTQPPQGQPIPDTTDQQPARSSVQDPASQQKIGSSGNSNESAGSNEAAESSPGTPLSPTSAEILGKLVRKPSKGKATQSAGQDKASVRKVKKRPQPVVAEAYSRRW
ncbi:hypothetical protein EG329_009023 [Mollisiaceae sp. DMI_Dod_QoI]|nr:hypothetical protein EG329_009023 [Helotiales sp. DMI_Dod_QoI]